jgi:Tol biopolymer transport system component
MDIWTMRADGSDKRRLTMTDEYDTEPTWSPDGARIAFRRSSPVFGSDLATIAASGGAVTRVPHAGSETAPAWSPDGRFIAFAHQPVGGGNPQLYTMRPDGSEITLRTTDYSWAGGRNPGWVRRQR